jgi:hypothetical protein
MKKERFAFLLLLLVFPVVSDSATYYASPTGSGTTCSQNAPCSRTTGIGRLTNGDTLILLNGVYTGLFRLTSAHSGAAGQHNVIRAASKNGATFRLTATCGTTTGNLTDIKANYVTMRGIVFDGCRYAGAQGLITLGNVGSSPVVVHDIIFEHNTVRDAQASGLNSALGTHRITIRHNTFLRTGHRQHWGECLYIHFTSSQIYGNTFDACTENAIDMKTGSNIDIHHNIIQNNRAAIEQSPELGCGGCVDPTRGYANQGNIAFIHGPDGNVSNSRAHNNIFRNNEQGAYGPLYTTRSAGNRFDHNVAFGATNAPRTSNRLIIKSLPGVTTEVDHNTYCTMLGYVCEGCTALNIHDNVGFPGSGAPQATCNAEQSRILNEINALPGRTY